MEENHEFRVSLKLSSSQKSTFLYFPRNPTRWDEYMLNDVTLKNFEERFQLVESRGKDTVQCEEGFPKEGDPVSQSNTCSVKLLSCSVINVNNITSITGAGQVHSMSRVVSM